MTPLAALVTGQMQRRGWSPQQVEERGIPHSTLYRCMRPTALSQPPRKATLKKLAEVLDLPLGDVQRAAVESVGYVFKEPDHAAIAPRDEPAGDDDPVAAAIRADTRLVPEAREHLLRQHALLLRIQPNPEAEAIRAEVRQELAEEAGLRSVPKGPSRNVRPRA